MTIELEREVGHRLEPRIGDRVKLTRPRPGDAPSMYEDVWQRRREQPSIVVAVSSSERRDVHCIVHCIVVGDRAHDVWTGASADVEVIGRALYTDTARQRAVEHVELLAENARLTGETAMLREQTVEAEYRRELAESVAREMAEQYPPRLYLPGDAEPAQAEPIGGIVIRNAVFALGAGFVYRQMHEDEWYAAHLSHSVFSWEQVLGDGPCLEVQNAAGVGRLFDVIRDCRAYERDITHGVWDLERLLDTKVREHELDAPRDTERPGTAAEARAVMARAASVIYKLSTAARKAQQ